MWEGAELLRQVAEKGDAFSQYMVGNVLFYGDYLVIRGDEESRKYKILEMNITLLLIP